MTLPPLNDNTDFDKWSIEVLKEFDELQAQQMAENRKILIAALGAIGLILIPKLAKGKFAGISDFSPSEFKYPDMMQRSLLTLLQRARSIAGIPFVIISDYRPPANNSSAGGAKNSAHLRGYAVDIRALGSARETIVKAAVEAGFKRIGIYPNSVHLDTDPSLPSPAYWGSDYTAASAPYNPFQRFG